MTDDTETLQRATEAVLLEGGASEVLVQQSAAGWLVKGQFGGVSHVGHTGIDPRTSSDPRDMARKLVGIAGGARPGAVPSAPMPLPIAPVEDEDLGEQPEIFDDEELAGAGEAEENPGHEDAEDLRGDSSSEGTGEPDLQSVSGLDRSGAEQYPGLVILPDELGARRNAVLASITAEKLTRLSIAMDPSRADFLAGRFTEYQNAGALGLAIDDGLLADRDAFLAMKDRTDRITAYALSLERAAIEADSDMLSAMHAGLGDGWP